MKPLSPNKKKVFRILGICTLALAAVGGFWWMRPPNALERATKVVTVPEWRGGKSSAFGGYSWAANGDLLTYAPDRKGGGAIFQHSSGTSQFICKLDENTEAPSSKLEQAAAQGGWVEDASELVSSDVLTVRRTKGDFTIRKYRLTPSDAPSFQVDMRPFWSLDKKTLFYIDSGGTKLHRLRPDIDAKESLVVENLPDALFNTDVWTMLGETKTGHLLIANSHVKTLTNPMSSKDAPDRIEVIEAGLGTEKSFMQTNSIELIQTLNETNYPTLTLSPKGDRLFLGVASVRQPPFLDWLHKRISWMPERAYCVEQGWVMNLDGSGKHLIGEFTLPVEEGKEHPWIVEPKWTPDGKKISFRYDDGIYTIPAD